MIKKILQICLIIILLNLILNAQSASKKIYFIDNINGNNTNSGLSKTSAVKTFEKGMALVKPGDTVNILNTGKKFIETLKPITSGTKEKPIFINGHNSIIDGDLKLDNCFEGRGVSYYTVINLICINSKNDGFNIHEYNGRCIGYIFSNIESSNCRDDGFSLHEKAQAKVYNSRFHHNVNGIQDIQESITEYYNCRMDHNKAYGMQGAGDLHIISNCYLYDNALDTFSGVQLDINEDARAAVIHCDIEGGVNGIIVSGGATLRMKYSVIKHSIKEDFKIESTYDGDYNLFLPGEIAIYNMITNLAGLKNLLDTDKNSEATAENTRPPYFIKKKIAVGYQNHPTPTPTPDPDNCWWEDFNLKNYVKNDNGDTAWTAERADGKFLVKSGEFLCSDGRQEEGVWTSEKIDISAADSVSISIYIHDGQDNKVKEQLDYVKAYYILDKKKEVLFGAVNSEIDPQYFKISGLQGKTLQIIIKASTSSDDEHYYIDNIVVTGKGIGKASK